MGTNEWWKLGVGGVVQVHFDPVMLAKADDGPGELEGWASVYNVVDDQDDIVVAGAFTKTLADWRRGARVIALTNAHDNSPSGVIGSVAKAADSAYGLKLTFKYAATPDAQAIRSKAKDGHIMGLSIFGPIVRHSFETRNGRDLRVIQEGGLWAVGMTPMPVNEKALITAAKGTDAEVPDAAGVSSRWICDLKSALEIANAHARKAAVDLLVKARYTVTDTPAPTPSPADPAPTDAPADVDASSYALSLIGETPTGPGTSPPGGEPSSLSLADQLLATIDTARTSADIDAFAAELGMR